MYLDDGQYEEGGLVFSTSTMEPDDLSDEAVVVKIYNCDFPVDNEPDPIGDLLIRPSQFDAVTTTDEWPEYVLVSSMYGASYWIKSKVFDSCFFEKKHPAKMSADELVREINLHLLRAATTKFEGLIEDN